MGNGIVLDCGTHCARLQSLNIFANLAQTIAYFVRHFVCLQKWVNIFSILCGSGHKTMIYGVCRLLSYALWTIYCIQNENAIFNCILIRKRMCEIVKLYTPVVHQTYQTKIKSCKGSFVFSNGR